MKDVLADLRKELCTKGLIDQDLLASGVGNIASLVRHGRALFGLKDGKLMVLPFLDPGDPLFDRVIYYTKETVKVKFSGLASLLSIISKDGSSAKYTIKDGKADMRSIVSAFNACRS